MPNWIEGTLKLRGRNGDLRRKTKMNIKPILCKLGPNGKCPEDCYTNDGPLCDFDKCPYENEADKKNGIKDATKEQEDEEK